MKVIENYENIDENYKEFLMQMKDVENELKRIVNRLIE